MWNKTNRNTDDNWNEAAEVSANSMQNRKEEKT